nr:eukaryotic translation initiation factor 3 subunit G [Pelodiscus sinensis]|eukprot:XP_025037799.1 eukaryotic translation initiation factor 3 subunit G [Pelodiscus sinensis]
MEISAATSLLFPDKCVTSELLKDLPLSGGLSVTPTVTPQSVDLSADAELLKGGPLPSPKELINGNIKTITEYREEEDGRKVKIIRTFRIETRKASKAVARRKNWKKFGNSEFDAPGPNVATTTVSDDVFMTFITSKEDLNCQEEEDPMNKLKGQKIVSCRICKGDHWTTRCPYKDTLGPMQKELAEQLGLSTGEKEKLPGGAAGEGRGHNGALWLDCGLASGGKAGPQAWEMGRGLCPEIWGYVKGDLGGSWCHLAMGGPSGGVGSPRGGAHLLAPLQGDLGGSWCHLAMGGRGSPAWTRRALPMCPRSSSTPWGCLSLVLGCSHCPDWPLSPADDNATIRVTNLSEDTRETDLQELFRPFGSISRIYLAKDKTTGQSKGFAFISFHRREDAARAIAGVSGFGYDHLILSVEWAKPSTN